MRRTALLIGLLVFALGVSALAGPGEYQLIPNRDTSLSYDVGLGSTGGNWVGRGAKRPGGQQENVSLWSWDQAATQAFINAHGGRSNIEASSFNVCVGNDGIYVCQMVGKVALSTFHLAPGEDWVEGNGMEAWYDWNSDVQPWPEGELRATWNWQQVTWKYEEGYKVQDMALSKKWKDAAGTEVNAIDQLPKAITNSLKLNDPDPPAGLPGVIASETWGSVALDLVGVDPAPSFFDDLVYTADCRGFMLWCSDVKDANNWMAHFRETVTQAGHETHAPYMQLKFFDRIGDANYDRAVDYLDLGALAGHYRQVGGATWNDGDFNKDGNVDYLDLGLLAGVYRSTDPPIYTPGQPLPEPISLLLLAGLTPLLRRRR